MNYRVVKNTIGDEIRIPHNGKTDFCPICGTSFNGCMVYYGDRDPGEEICPGCNMQFGDDDIPGHSDGSITTDEYFQKIRIQWLIKNNWDKHLLNQLSTVLGIDTESIQKIMDQ
tara:strand:- start:87386 stop:87727 length:342 start_codon:yes stop_codon:yes gene_type:complete